MRGGAGGGCKSWVFDKITDKANEFSPLLLQQHFFHIYGEIGKFSEKVCLHFGFYVMAVSEEGVLANSHTHTHTLTS